MKKFISEPLLHFVLIGGLLFFIYDMKQEEIVAENPTSIVITEANIDQLINQWHRRWQRLPSQQELQGLVKAKIHEEVLYREALAMGLDKDDSVVRQRMARKIEFITNDLASLVEPTDSQLQSYLNAHVEKFRLQGQITFSHIYLSADKRGEQLQSEAKELLLQLTSATTDIDIPALGDPFMSGQLFDSLSDFDVERLFGNAFSEQLFTVSTGKWVGPIKSGYGLHLVRIDARTNSLLPSLVQVRNKVQSEWLREQQKKANDAFYAELHKRYQITIELPNAPLPEVDNKEKS